MGLFAQETKTTSVGEPGKTPSFVLDENGSLVETTAPIITFAEENFDFSEVEEGPQVSHDFKFTNTGKEPLVLSNVKASCGCTTPEWTKDPVLPGESGIIKVTYNTKGRPGPFNKSITITSNAYQPTSRVFIKGSVKAAPKEETTPVKTQSPIMIGNN